MSRYLKNISDFMTSHDGSTVTTLDTFFPSFKLHALDAQFLVFHARNTFW
jgi:hypothetical protein